MIIAMAYTDIPSYKIFINSNENEKLLFCKSLALNGSNKQKHIDHFKITLLISGSSKNPTTFRTLKSLVHVAMHYFLF